MLDTVVCLASKMLSAAEMSLLVRLALTLSGVFSVAMLLAAAFIFLLGACHHASKEVLQFNAFAALLVGTLVVEFYAGWFTWRLVMLLWWGAAAVAA
jgi:hypothetical protein